MISWENKNPSEETNLSRNLSCHEVKLVIIKKPDCRPPQIFWELCNSKKICNQQGDVCGIILFREVLQNLLYKRNKSYETETWRKLYAMENMNIEDIHREF